MSDLRRSLGAFKGPVRYIGATTARWKRHGHPEQHQPGVTVVMVNWNSLPCLSGMLGAVRAMSPPDTEMLVVDTDLGGACATATPELAPYDWSARSLA